MRFGFIGDIGLIGAYSQPDEFCVGKELRILFNECEYLIGNLETVLCKPQLSTLPSSVHVRSNVESVEILKNIGIHAVNLANNHIFDFGKAGLMSTISLLEKNNIEWFGVHGKVLSLDSARVRIHGFCSYSTNGNNYGTRSLHPLSAKSVQRAIEADRREGYYSIFNLHWGLEHAYFPTIKQRRFVERFSSIDTLFIGHHSHTIQPVVKSEKLTVCYSLGNFCFDDVHALKVKDFTVRMTPRNREGLYIIADTVGDIQQGGLSRLNKLSVFGTQMDGARVNLSEKVRSKSEVLNKEFRQLSITEIERRREEDHRNQIAEKFGAKRDWKWVRQRLNYNTIVFKIIVFRNRIMSKVIGI